MPFTDEQRKRWATLSPEQKRIESLEQDLALQKFTTGQYKEQLKNCEEAYAEREQELLDLLKYTTPHKPDEHPPIKEEYSSFTRSIHVLAKTKYSWRMAYLQVYTGEDCKMKPEWRIAGREGFSLDGVLEWRYLWPLT